MTVDINQGLTPLLHNEKTNISTVFENHSKSLIQHYERSELHQDLEWRNVFSRFQKWSLCENLKFSVLNSVTTQVTFFKGQKCWKVQKLNATF